MTDKPDHSPEVVTFDVLVETIRRFARSQHGTTAVRFAVWLASGAVVRSPMPADAGRTMRFPPTGIPCAGLGCLSLHAQPGRRRLDPGGSLPARNSGDLGSNAAGSRRQHERSGPRRVQGFAGLERRCDHRRQGQGHRAACPPRRHSLNSRPQNGSGCRFRLCRPGEPAPTATSPG